MSSSPSNGVAPEICVLFSGGKKFLSSNSSVVTKLHNTGMGRRDKQVEVKLSLAITYGDALLVIHAYFTCYPRGILLNS